MQSWRVMNSITSCWTRFLSMLFVEASTPTSNLGEDPSLLSSCCELMKGKDKLPRFCTCLWQQHLSNLGHHQLLFLVVFWLNRQASHPPVTASQSISQVLHIFKCIGDHHSKGILCATKPPTFTCMFLTSMWPHHQWVLMHIMADDELQY